MKNLNQLKILIVALSGVLAVSSFCSSALRKGLVQYQSVNVAPSP
jgi:hypothetical protein